MKDQGIGEYIFILVLVVVVVIAVLEILAPAADRLLHDKSMCYTHDEKSMECINERMEACLKTEQYTKDQCVILVGGTK